MMDKYLKLNYFTKTYARKEDFEKYIRENNINLKKVSYEITTIDGLQDKNDELTCIRCGNNRVIKLKDKSYCNNCLEFGRIDSATKLIKLSIPSKENINTENKLAELKLTRRQMIASNFIISGILAQKDVLIHAVCGAGKTEITFKAISKVLEKGLLIAFAIPRIDILYEVAERISYYFPNIRVVILNSKEEKVNYGNIFVLTTNQIIKFKDAFSLIIVDEVDAFPYEYNFKYDYGANTAKTDHGIIVYLTSTPSWKMLEKSLPTYVINRRWHDFLLPVPRLKYFNLDTLLKGNMSKSFLEIINLHFNSSKQLIIFISNIVHVKKVYNLLIKEFQNNLGKQKSFAYVYSGKEDRLEVIDNFRKGNFKVLITTTILERGVTFDNIDVIVLDTSNNLYTKASLVQIAGRVGRKKEYQEGEVWFYYKELTWQIEESVKEIEKLNN